MTLVITVDDIVPKKSLELLRSGNYLTQKDMARICRDTAKAAGRRLRRKLPKKYTGNLKKSVRTRSNTRGGSVYIEGDLQNKKFNWIDKGTRMHINPSKRMFIPLNRKAHYAYAKGAKLKYGKDYVLSYTRKGQKGQNHSTREIRHSGRDFAGRVNRRVRGLGKYPGWSVFPMSFASTKAG